VVTPPIASDIVNLARALSLHAGEIEALHAMQEFAGDLLLTDDAAARLAAGQLSMRAHGTLGVLLRAIRRRQRSAAEVAAILRSLPTSSTLHVRQAFLNGIVEQVERLI
jgi:predicted nucleic acid-binding protein